MLVQYIAENFRINIVNYMHKYMCTGSIRGMAVYYNKEIWVSHKCT